MEFNNDAIIPDKNSTTVAALQLEKCFENNENSKTFKSVITVIKETQCVHTHIHDFVYYLDEL